MQNNNYCGGACRTTAQPVQHPVSLESSSAAVQILNLPDHFAVVAVVMNTNLSINTQLLSTYAKAVQYQHMVLYRSLDLQLKWVLHSGIPLLT